MSGTTHRPVRGWPRPWRRECACGLRWPCPDELWQPSVSAVPDGSLYRSGAHAARAGNLTPAGWYRVTGRRAR
jgi:hypothetical protein